MENYKNLGTQVRKYKNANKIAKNASNRPIFGSYMVPSLHAT